MQPQWVHVKQRHGYGWLQERTLAIRTSRGEEELGVYFSERRGHRKAKKKTSKSSPDSAFLLTLEEVQLWPHYDHRLIPESSSSSAAMRTVIFKGYRPACDEGGDGTRLAVKEVLDALPSVVDKGADALTGDNSPSQSGTSCSTSAASLTNSLDESDGNFWWSRSMKNDWRAMLVPQPGSLAVVNPLLCQARGERRRRCREGPSSSSSSSCCFLHGSAPAATLSVTEGQQQRREGKRTTWVVRFPSYSALQAVIAPLQEAEQRCRCGGCVSCDSPLESLIIVGSLSAVSSRLWARTGS